MHSIPRWCVVPVRASLNDRGRAVAVAATPQNATTTTIVLPSPPFFFFFFLQLPPPPPRRTRNGGGGGGEEASVDGAHRRQYRHRSPRAGAVVTGQRQQCCKRPGGKKTHVDACPRDGVAGQPSVTNAWPPSKMRFTCTSIGVRRARDRHRGFRPDTTIMLFGNSGWRRACTSAFLYTTRRFN